MADVAHDASGPAPSRVISPDNGKLRVFISYSRNDLDFADQLNAALEACGFECFIDRHGISGGEDWKQRLGNLISEADTVVFVLSPASAHSDICAWEVEEAARLGKRILPVNCRQLEGTNPPPRLGDLNYIFFYADPQLPGSGFGTGLARLIAALSTDFDWLREHTRYLQRATEWDRGGRPANRLLSGDDIAEAKEWAARRPQSAPEPTALHLDFIRASEQESEAQSSAQRKQLTAMAAAQAERATALNKAEEALKRAADAQRKRARIRNVAFVVVSIFAVLAGWLYLRAELRRAEANDILASAQDIAAEVFPHLNPDTKKKVFALLHRGADRGDSTSMRNLGFLYRHGHGVPQDHGKAREWSEKAASKGNASALRDLGRIYARGQGVEQDYVKAREWFEKAAAMDDASALRDLGVLHANGLGVPQDFIKAREWYEKAAARDDEYAMRDLGVFTPTAREWRRTTARRASGTRRPPPRTATTRCANSAYFTPTARGWRRTTARRASGTRGPSPRTTNTRCATSAAKDNHYAMVNLGLLYANGEGAVQDYGKAREWYEKAAAKDNVSAEIELAKLSIIEAATAGRYAEALQLQEGAAEKAEAIETKLEGKPGRETAEALHLVSWYALFAREFTRALTAADRAHTLLPENLPIETNRAHALMFLGREGQSKALYFAHKGRPILPESGKLWERVIVDDFAELRQAGLTHPMMAEIENELGVSR